MGVAGVAVGVVTGILAASEASDISAGCVDNHCLPADAARGDAAETLGTVSTVGLVIGAAGIGVGVGLLVFGGSDEGAPKAALRAGPGSLTLRGAF